MCVCVCVCVCVFARKYTTIYIARMRICAEYVCMNVCTCMCTCRYVLLLPGFPGALEVPRVSFMVCLHDPEC